MFTTTPPSPPVFWNHRVRCSKHSKVEIRKDLYVKDSGIRTYVCQRALKSLGQRRVSPSCGRAHKSAAPFKPECRTGEGWVSVMGSTEECDRHARVSPPRSGLYFIRQDS